jgi:hypothetical protein
MGLAGLIDAAEDFRIAARCVDTGGFCCRSASPRN